MNRYASVVIALAVLAAAGLVHGFWAERWHSSTVLQEAAARVDKVPMEFGAWKGQAIAADAGAFVQTGALIFWTRSYVHEHNKTALLVILMCGRAGRMAVHTPEVCYRGAGYDLGGQPETLNVKSAQGETLGTFWTARFFKETGALWDLRLTWGWNGGSGWQAPTNPRWEFGGAPFLYKLYLSQDSPHGAGGTGGLSLHRLPSTDAAQDFMRQFLPKLHQTLFDVTD